MVLQGITCSTKLKLIGEWKLSQVSLSTREIQEAEEALRNLGIDVDTFVDQAQKNCCR